MFGGCGVIKYICGNMNNVQGYDQLDQLDLQV